MGPYFSHKTLLENFATLGNEIIYPRCFGAIFPQVFVIVKIEALNLQEILLCLLTYWPLIWQFFFYIVMMP
jgi:hypothetical protein